MSRLSWLLTNRCLFFNFYVRHHFLLLCSFFKSSWSFIPLLEFFLFLFTLSISCNLFKMFLHLIFVHLSFGLLQTPFFIYSNSFNCLSIFEYDRFRNEYLTSFIIWIFVTGHFFQEPIEVMLLKLEEITGLPIHFFVLSDFFHILPNTFNKWSLFAFFFGNLLFLFTIDFVHFLIA